MTRAQSAATQAVESSSARAPDPAITPTVRGAARRSLGWIIVASIALVIAAVTLLTTGTHGAGVALGATNAAPNGSRALVQVLRNHGVEVTGASTFADAEAAAGDGATVLVYDPDDFLDSSKLTELRSIGSSIVFVSPDFAALTAVAPNVTLAGDLKPGPALNAACTLAEAQRAGTMTRSGSAYRVSGSALGCFPSASGEYSVVRDSTSQAQVTLVGTTTIFRNDDISDAGNAALALNLLGAQPRLVWYLPTVADVAADGPPSLSALTPGWVTPTVLLLFAAAFAAAIWRGRRFGPLVIENLPVLVRSGETMEGRARLYQRSSARLRALDALRIGTIGRLAKVMGLPSTASVEAVTDAASALTGRDRGALLALLRDTEPQSDAELIALSDQLLDFEAILTRASRPGTDSPTERMDP